MKKKRLDRDMKWGFHHFGQRRHIVFTVPFGLTARKFQAHICIILPVEKDIVQRFSIYLEIHEEYPVAPFVGHHAVAKYEFSLEVF